MTRKQCLALLGCLLLAAGMLAMFGCESTTTGVTIGLTPASQTITAENGTVLFTAAATGGGSNAVLQLPLVWSVSDVSLGNIVSSGGMSAVYKRNGGATGGNAVIVRDQAEAEGVATVTQE